MTLTVWLTFAGTILGSGATGTLTAWMLKRFDRTSVLEQAVRELLLCRLEDLRAEMVARDGIADEDLKGRSQRLYDVYHELGGNGHGTALNDDIQSAPIAPRQSRPTTVGHKQTNIPQKGETLVKNKDKPKPRWKRLIAKVMALIAAMCMMTLPATAHADMQGVDMSNWQCGADVYNMQADFIVVGTTWGTGQVYNNCLVSGVNTDANRMIAQAQASGKRFGLYHYAMGGNPEAEARFFYANTLNYWRHGIVALDWEMDDNPAWGDWDWVRRFMAECERLSGGVRPLLYTGPVAGTIPQDIRDRYGLWIAQYANMSPTGYQADPWMLGAYGEAMRQYSGTGVVNTWSPIDLNIFRGDAWQWNLYANPAGGSTPPATPAAPAQPNTPPADTNTGGISHVMQWGETIWGLAVAYNAWPLSAWHTTSGDINRYYVGDVVTYGGVSATMPSNGVSKTIQYGDTVWEFATSHGYSVNRCTVPSGNINVYYPGDVVTCR